MSQNQPQVRDLNKGKPLPEGVELVGSIVRQFTCTMKDCDKSFEKRVPDLNFPPNFFDVMICPDCELDWMRANPLVTIGGEVSTFSCGTTI